MKNQMMYDLSVMLGEFFLYSRVGVIKHTPASESLFVPSVGKLLISISEDVKIILGPDDFVSFAALHNTAMAIENGVDLPEDELAVAKQAITENGTQLFEYLKSSETVELDEDLWNTAFEEDSDG